MDSPSLPISPDKIGRLSDLLRLWTHASYHKLIPAYAEMIEEFEPEVRVRFQIEGLAQDVEDALDLHSGDPHRLNLILFVIAPEFGALTRSLAKDISDGTTFRHVVDTIGAGNPDKIWCSLKTMVNEMKNDPAVIVAGWKRFRADIEQRKIPDDIPCARSGGMSSGELVELVGMIADILTWHDQPDDMGSKSNLARLVQGDKHTVEEVAPIVACIIIAAGRIPVGPKDRSQGSFVAHEIMAKFVTSSQEEQCVRPHYAGGMISRVEVFRLLSFF